MNRQLELICEGQGSMRRSSSSQSVADARAPECRHSKRARAGVPEVGGNLYPAPSKLSPEEIDNVVAYLQTRIVGKGKITKQECLLYYTDKPDWCDDYN